ncbi:hypothetical protein HZS61_003269 [Fusarium oxysporum f. sp. conglutinans]|uniref:HTH CENPB-type domain-containing protein n=3 Tax=Fusarium oxysporum f. sp. conglutinans TaxID=100902 RepID=A0A8H6GGG0_FUSOX|nr:hypothetical protein HZS61_003269 [Fusarium oxysporum f. sp. conglutinans]KAG6989514.1 Pogo transposable element with KRAB domain [Fusarium oxysporum f. sp. conglutinans]KAG6990508.1 Pogo transposable element with KRAB domain [Fusarium oxysporum f. sp. conglutinans]
MSDLNTESRIILAMDAKRKKPKLSIRHLAKQFSISRTTLQARITGRPSKTDTHSSLSNLTMAEEDAIVQYISQLDSRGFSPRKADVEDMANLLLLKRDERRVGKCWTDRFIARQPKLCTRFSRPYDYQRALQEDPDVLSAWFRLVANMRAKYGIQDSDFYNFDETGFMMGMIRARMVVTRSDRINRPKAVQPGNREWVTAICAVAADGHTVPPFLCVAGRFHLAAWYSGGQIPGTWVIKTTPNGWTDHDTGLEWLKHFDQQTKARQKGQYRMLVLDGHESHINAEFNEYCKANKIIPLCLPSHSSHLTQPLDVGVFGPLKKAYGSQISFLTRASITHITKDDFFPAFKAAFELVFTEKNIKSSFQGAGLVPWNPEAVTSRLDVRLRTPTPPETPDVLALPWISQTPRTATEALSQSTLIKDRVSKHQGSSPTPILASVDQLAKATVSINHQLTLLTGEIKALREANEALSKRRSAKRTRLQDSGPLTGKKASQFLVKKGVVEEEGRDEGAGGGPSKRHQTGARLCGICRKSGHNARTCPEAEDIDEASNHGILDSIECVFG